MGELPFEFLFENRKGFFFHKGVMDLARPAFGQAWVLCYNRFSALRFFFFQLVLSGWVLESPTRPKCTDNYIKEGAIMWGPKPIRSDRK